jgi:hypothetical protein
VAKDDIIVMDGTDIGKKHAKYLERSEFVKNGDTWGIASGYKVLKINVVSDHKEI